MRLVQKKPGGNFFCFYYAGKTGIHSFSTKTNVRSEALQLIKDSKIKELEFAARSGAVSQEVVNMVLRGGEERKMGSLLKEWCNWMAGNSTNVGTAHARKRAVQLFIKFTQCEEWEPEEITDTDINKFINQKSSHKANYRRYSLGHLCSFFDWMHFNNYCSKNVARLAKVQYDNLTHEQLEPAKRIFITDEQYESVLKYCRDNDNKFWLAAAIIGRKTALRLGDICNLQWAMLDDNLTVWTRKSDTRVTLEVVDELRAVFNGIEKTNSPYIFPEYYQRYFNVEWRCQISNQFVNICKKCGFKGSFHCLRRARLVEVTAWWGIHEAQRQAAHKSAKTTEIYVSQNI